MKFLIFGKNIEVTDGLKQQVETKLSKLERYFSEDTEVSVTLKVEKGDQIVEVIVHVNGGGLIRAEEHSPDMYASIDMVEDTIERRLRKNKTKLLDKYQSGSYAKEYLEEDFDENEEEIKIVRTKSFGLKPMFTEDACLQMDLIGHNFFVFLNAETEEVNVVYKRKKGGYGLIEPELG